MRIAAFLLLLVFSKVNFIIGLLMTYALPENHIIQGPVISYVPFMMAAFSLVLSILTLMTFRNQNPPPLKEPGMSRWFWLTAGASMFISGWWVSLLALYAPDVFGSKDPLPQAGVIIFLITSLAVSAVLFFTSQMNSTRRPNLLRYLVLVITVGAFFMTTSFCLVLIFAAPHQPPTTFPFLAGILSMAYLPFSVLIYLLAKTCFSSGKSATN